MLCFINDVTCVNDICIWESMKIQQEHTESEILLYHVVSTTRRGLTFASSTFHHASGASRLVEAKSNMVGTKLVIQCRSAPPNDPILRCCVTKDTAQTRLSPAVQNLSNWSYSWAKIRGRGCVPLYDPMASLNICTKQYCWDSVAR